MSKLASFVTGFGTGMTMANEYEDRKRRREREDRMDKREEERYQRDEAYRKDMEAAGQVMVNGTSGVGGVNVGSQQDALLASQNMRGEGGGSGGNAPVSGGFGIMRDVALRHGRVAEAAQFSGMQANEDTRAREDEWRKGRMALIDTYQKSGKTRQDALNFYKSVGELDFRYGKANLGDLATVDDRAEKMKKEGVFDALNHYWATGDLAGALDKFDAVGEQKIDRNTVQVSVNKDPLTGQDIPVITGRYQGGQTFQFDPDRLSHLLGGYEGYLASRKQAIDANDKAADNTRADKTLAETMRHNKASESADMVKATNSGSGGVGGVGKFKDLSPDDIKSSFTTYRDVVKPASSVGGKARVEREPVVDQAALAEFRAWAKQNRYNDMNLALRDWDSEGRPKASSKSGNHGARSGSAPANRRPLSEIFR